MATVHPTAPAEALSVPRYVRNLNAIAERAGLSVTMRAAPLGDGPESHLLARWEGTLEQLAATGLLAPHTIRRLQWARASSRHANGGRCQLSSSSDVAGEAHVNGDRVVWEIDWGPMLYTIERRGDVEIITYAHEVVYHGSAEALVAAGIHRKNLPTGKHTGKSRYGIVEGPEPAWWARRQPDGLHVYRRESEELIRIRCEQEAQWRRKRQEEEARRNAPKPVPENAAEWKARTRRSFALWIGCVVGDVDGKSLAEPRFRLEDAALQRIRAVTERFRHELQAELDEARVIDTQAPQRTLRLAWSAPSA